ncbi:MAG TPA: DUF3341 domain-containing protein [Terriglobales bacterium]|nr:DUF3341 domain-containing protein [Terriglobales bacterium]
MKRSGVYGLMAEFKTPTEVVIAARKAYSEGYRRMDAYSPFPVEGLSEAIGFHKDGVALACLVGGLLGLLSAYGLQSWINIVAYPLNIGGRPYHSWPSFIIVTFELTILIGGLSAGIGMLIMNGLPTPYHPVFHVPEFAHASRDRFFLCIESRDPKFDLQTTRQFLSGLSPQQIAEVPY